MAYYKCGSVYTTQNSNVVVDTASGAMANFQTPLAMPLLKTRFDFKATQEAGTPTPQSPKAISGVSAVSVIHTRENLVDIRSFSEWVAVRSSYFVLRNCIPNTVINVSLIDKDTSIDLSGISFGFVDSKWTGEEQLTTLDYRWFIQGGTPQNTKKNFSVADASVILTGLIFYPQTEETYNKLMARYDYEFELNTVSEYHAYNGSTTLINLGGTYYGGYVSQDKAGHRQLVVTHKRYDLSALSWQVHQQGYYYATKPDDMYKYLSTETPEWIAEKYQKATGQWIYGHGSTIGYIGANGGLIYCTDSTTPNGYMVAPLTEPIVIDLPDGQPIKSFAGINNIYADIGDTSVQFRKIG